MTIATLVPMVGTTAACRAVGQPRSSWYRHHRRSPAPPRPPWPPRRPQPRALGAAERRQVLEVLHAERFWDAAPATVYATLLDEGSYLCSIATMYRLLRQHGEAGDRRRHASHPARVKPELVATRPNQVWSWDLTKLAGQARWSWFYLYTILDIYSRYVVGWMVAAGEAATLAERLLADTIAAQGVEAGTLTVHADRGTSMTAKPVAMLLADLGVTRSYSRPHVPGDNPYSESQFKTLKHHPAFPARFGCIQDARAFCQGFLRLVQPRAPPLRHRAADPRRCAPRPRRADHPGARCSAGRRLRRPSGAVRRQATPAALPAEAVWINKPLDPTEAPQQSPG
jgi:putative transposase